MEYIHLEKDADGIIELVFDQPGKSVNTMGDEYLEAMAKTVSDLEEQVAGGGVTGVYLRSGKESFFGGGDLNGLLETPTEMDAEEASKQIAGILNAKAPLRRLETLAVPVAVGINGAALGGGYEICLACHHRVMLNRKHVQVGLPEAQMGLMPGAGGVVRMTRKFGCEDAIAWISSGRSFKPEKALALGWVDELADSEEEMHAKAKAWLRANSEARQPWDMDDFRVPGGAPCDKEISSQLRGLIGMGPVNVMNTTNGNQPAAQAIFACVHDVACVDFDSAEKIEARYFLHLSKSQVAKNMINTFFFQHNAIKRGADRPSQVPPTEVRKLGIIGAGQMGAGIALAAARAGIEVILKDVTLENAEKGKAYAERKCNGNKRLSRDQAAVIVGRILATEDIADMAGCDLVIEAVFEDRELKANVTREAETVVDAECVFASNTSALPIGELAQASDRPANFIGMHFFSPAETMPLVEIICGEKTADETLARAFDLAAQLGKTAITVNDSPGFFTTRVIGTTINQGINMLLEGVNPVLIENAARFNGSPVGPLAVLDEISQQTGYTNGLQAREDVLARGEIWEETPSFIMMSRMVNEFKRPGKVHGAGFYVYPENGKKYLWPGLKQAFAGEAYREIPFEDVRDRLTFSQCLEAVRAMEEGVIQSVAAGNIGSIFGIGFPGHTGGVFQFINAWGLRKFVARARELAERYGAEFESPQLLIERAEKEEPFV